MARREWPHWWDWEIELNPHLLKRMQDRDFTEVDLRRMLAEAKSLRQDVAEGRWVAESRLSRRSWDVVLEPDFAAKVIVVVTAYPTDS